MLANQGEYPFTITNVPAGPSRLFAGTDADDDALLCDAGEACGAFPTLDAPDFLVVNGDRSNLEFEAGFRVNLSATTTSAAASSETENSLAIDKTRARRGQR